jgi:hypothetical protein
MDGVKTWSIVWSSCLNYLRAEKKHESDDMV